VMESYNGMFSAILQGIQQYRQMAFAQVLASVTNACFIIITVVLLHLGIKGLIVSRLMALLTAMLYQQRVARTSIRLSFNTVMAKKIMNFGVFLGVNNILSFIFSRIDTLIIGAVMNPIGVALYGTAAKIPDASRQLFESFRSVFFPNMAELFSKQKKEEAEAILNNSLRLVSFLSLLLSLIIMIFLNDVVKILFSKKYIECAPVLSLLMVAMCIGLIGNVLGTSLVAAGYSKLPALINVVDATVCVIANLALIPPFGITGAAYAAILARVATTPVNVYFLRKNGINVSILQFVRPIAVFGGCSVLLAVYDGYIYKILILLLYILLSTCFLIITRDDVLSVKRVFLILPQSANTK
jgi:O-antigen/teichoic acid export membrane protein